MPVLPKIPGIEDFGPPEALNVSQAIALIGAEPPPVLPQQASYEAPPAGAPTGGKYRPAVERWRGAIIQEYQKQGVPLVLNGVDLVDKALHVIDGESGGNEKAVGDGGAAYGIFQSHYVGSGASAQKQVEDAVRLIARNPSQWTDWGEGATYQGKPFGALGAKPYGSQQAQIGGTQREIHNGQLLPEGAPGEIRNPPVQFGSNLPEGLLKTAVIGSTPGVTQGQAQDVNAQIQQLPAWAQQDIREGPQPTLGALQPLVEPIGGPIGSALAAGQKAFGQYATPTFEAAAPPAKLYGLTRAVARDVGGVNLPDVSRSLVEGTVPRSPLDVALVGAAAAGPVAKAVGKAFPAASGAFGYMDDAELAAEAAKRGIQTAGKNRTQIEDALKASEAPLSDLERALQAGLRGKKPVVTDPPTPFLRNQAMTEAGIDTSGLKTASQIDTRWRQYKAEVTGGIAAPTENTANAARKAYNDVLTGGGAPDEAAQAARQAAAQETQANRRAQQLSGALEGKPATVEEGVRQAWRDVSKTEWASPQEKAAAIDKAVTSRLGSDAEVTLYRGINPTRNRLSGQPETEGPGGWWTTDKARATRYAGKEGEVYQVKLKASELADPEITNAVGGIRGDEWKIAPELQRGAGVPDVNPTEVYGEAATKLPPIQGGAAANVVLTREQTAALSHFTDMTKGVIENHSTMQKVYDSVRPVTNIISGAASDSRVAELIARDAELRSMITRVGPKLTDAEVDTVVRTWRAGMLRRAFRGDPAGLKAARTAFAEYIKAQKPSGYDAITDVWRTATLNGDVSVLGQNLEASVRRGIVPTTSGVLNDAANRIASVLHMPGGPQIYLRNDVGHVEQAIADSLQMGGGSTADIARKTVLGRIPVAGPKVEAALNALSDFQYGNIMGTVRLRAYEGLLAQNAIIRKLTFGKLGGDITDPLVRRHIAEMANMIGSTARGSTTPVRSTIERRGLLTARMTRAQVNEVLTPLKAFRSQEDVINLMNYVGSVALTLGAGKALNDQFGIGDFVTDPLKPGFGRIVLPTRDSKGRHHVIDIMPQATFGKAILSSVGAITSQDWQKLGDSWTRFGVGRLNIFPSVAAKFAGYGYDSEGRFHSGDLSKEQAISSAAPIPLGARQTVLQGETDPLSVGFAVTGQSSFPESTSGLRNRLAQDVQPDASGRYPTATGAKPETFNDLLPSAQKALNEREDVAASKATETQTPYQKAKDAAYAPIQALQDQAETAFKSGQLTQSLPDLWHEISIRRDQARVDLEREFTKTFSKYDKDAFDKALDGYYAIDHKNADGTINWDATEAARLSYMGKQDAQTQTWLNDFLDTSKTNASPLRQAYLKYIDERDKLGYFKDKADTKALDRSNPSQDALNWYWKGGVTGKAPPTLQTAEAVNQALAMNLPNRAVKFDGISREINQSPQIQQLWKEQGTRLANYLDDSKIVAAYGDREARTLYQKPYAQLTPNEQSSVRARIRSGLRKSSPTLVALLAYMGHSISNGEITLPRDTEVTAALKALQARYGGSPVAQGVRYVYAKE